MPPIRTHDYVGDHVETLDLEPMPNANINLLGDGTDGLPVATDFRTILYDYYDRLNPKKRDKALISQEMYVAIHGVLIDPKDTSTSTAQFRYWCRKMFRLANIGDAEVIVHENRPVAVKEQIYSVLANCHHVAGHGGRDRTSAQVRRYYSYIPKEIMAQFVKICPTCNNKRNASRGLFSSSPERAENTEGSQNEQATSPESPTSASPTRPSPTRCAPGHAHVDVYGFPPALHFARDQHGRAFDAARDHTFLHVDHLAAPPMSAASSRSAQSDASLPVTPQDFGGPFGYPGAYTFGALNDQVAAGGAGRQLGRGDGGEGITEAERNLAAIGAGAFAEDAFDSTAFDLSTPSGIALMQASQDEMAKSYYEGSSRHPFGDAQAMALSAMALLVQDGNTFHPYKMGPVAESSLARFNHGVETGVDPCKFGRTTSSAAEHSVDISAGGACDRATELFMDMQRDLTDTF
jgi:hypothetical protein